MSDRDGGVPFNRLTPFLWLADSGVRKDYAFHCPGCGHLHSYTVGGYLPGEIEALKERNGGKLPDQMPPRWTFNGNLERPTFTASLLINKDHPKSRCHLFVTDGQIVYQQDCHHDLRGKTVAMVDIDTLQVRQVHT